jgi:hypothetical protein
MSQSALIVATLLLTPSTGFVLRSQPSFGHRRSSILSVSTELDTDVLIKTAANAFLPKETLERAQKGSPIEKIKLEKDVTSAWIDVYEYARKIRDGEMTWEEVEKAG